VWLIPRGELPEGEPSYRATAFHNDGQPGAVPDPSTSGGDISGAGTDDPLLPVPGDVVDFDADDTIPPDIDGTQPREAFDDDPYEHLTRVLIEEFFARIDGALTSGDRDGVIATVMPQLLAGPNGAQCIAELEALLLQANSVALNSVPAGPDLTNGFALYTAQAQIDYPTGTTPFPPSLAPGPGGRLYQLLTSCF
jgi:hypothetical protein